MGRQNRRNRKNTKLLFLKVFGLSLLAFGVVLICGFIFLRSIIKPPEIPLQTALALELPSVGDSAFAPAESHEEDLSLGNGLPAPEGFTDDDRKEQFYTFLIVGMDGGINTDTIMIASYDAKNQQASIIGIPRDSLVNVKRRVKKINSAYAAGTLNGGGKEGGINQLRREIKTVAGFVPDFYIAIDLEAFVEIVDAVDGVLIDVPFDMIYDDPGQNLHINIKKGERLLDGKDALKFARYRYGNNSNYTISDYQRIENQQAVIKAMLTKLTKPENLLKIPRFISIFNEYVASDIKPENMLWFAEQLNKIKGTEALSTYTMPTTGTSGPPSYYEYLDEDAIVELINNTVNPYKKDIEAKDLDIITDVK